MKYSCISMLCALLLATGLLKAQQFTGRVTDPSGAVVPKATITAHNVDTNLNTTAVSTNSGDYTIPYLKAGNYTVSATAPGFEGELHNGINLQVEQTATVNFALKIGRSTETVTVTGDPLIDFGKADVGEVIENTRVTELPLNGRDPGMLSILSAGVQWNQGATQFQRPFDDTQHNTAINGGGTGNVALLLDGVTNEASSTNGTGNAQIAYVPPVDSVQEFRIITNAYDAMFGRNAGGVEDVILKSGTNKIHGDVYEYARRTFLDANSWQNKYYIAKALPGANVAQYTTQKHKLDQYGFELDGPVIIPKLFNGRDKTFFTMQYENWNEIQPNTVTDSVPDPAWLNGDFSNLTYLNKGVSTPVTIYDPLTATQNSSGQYVRTPFPGNMIPASRINPVAQKILSFYPKPNVATPAGAAPFQSNYVVAGSDSNRYRNGLAKVDQNLSSKDRFSLHYGYWERVEDRTYHGFPSAADNGQLPHGERSHTFTLEEVHTFSPNLLFDLRANVTVRADYTFGGPRFDPTTLGLSAADVTAMGTSAANEFPLINFSDNYASLGQNNTGQTVSNSLALFPSVTWIKNKHTIHGGLDSRFQQSGKNLVSGGNNLSVDRYWTQQIAGLNTQFDASAGNSIASFLLGNLTSGSNTINPKTYFSTHYWAPFVQDDWKVTKKLTLNLGVRWDFDPAQTERNNYGNYAFNTTVVNPVSSLVSVPGHSQLLGGLTFLGVGGAPRAQFALTKFNVQPRVGFAYAVNDKMVVRGGFGESFLGSSGNGAPTYGFGATTQYQASDPTQAPNVYPNLANPISHLYPSVVQPHGASLGLLEQLGQGPFSLNPNYKIPSFWTYSMGIEQQFGRSDTFKIEYVGTRLYNGNTSDNINHIDPAAYTPCNPDLGGRFEVCNNNNPVNPFKGVNGFQGSNYYNQTTINALNFTRPFPEYGDMNEYQLNDGHTWYNSLQVTAMHKWNKSLTLHGTWTWAKQLNSGGFQDNVFRVAARHIDGNDRTHRITLSGVYLLPVGRGRTFLGNTNRIVDAAIGGWELGSLFIYQTGVPYNVPGQDNQIASPYVHPYINPANGYIRLVAPCVEQWKEDTNGNYSLQQLPLYDKDYQCTGPNLKRVPNSNFGPNTNTVYTGVRVPSIYQFDTNLSKNYQLFERLALQVRMEAFNVLNHPLWSAQPDTNFNDQAFGEITRGPSGQSNIPRQIQLSAKITW